MTSADEAWLAERRRHGGADEVPLPETNSRLWLCGKHLVGPDPERALAAVGAGTVVCLTERFELADRYPAYVEWLDANAGGRAVWHPIPDLHAPSVDEAVDLVGRLRVRLSRGESLLVHCGAGMGRTGTVAAAVLVALGVSLDDACAEVARRRPGAGPEVGAQADLLAALAAARH